MGYQWAERFEDALKVMVVSLADCETENTDTAYLFCNTPDNEQSVLRGGYRLYKSGHVSSLHLFGSGLHRSWKNASDSAIAYRGFSAWRQYLVESGIKKEYIHAVPRLSGEPSHSGIEARCLIFLAKKEGWETIAAVAHPLHAPRAFVNAISMAVRYQIRVRIYSYPGPAEPWHKKVRHSQGLNIGTRIKLIESEWDRINRIYRNDLDLEPCSVILKYLAWRDGTTRKFPVSAW